MSNFKLFGTNVILSPWFLLLLSWINFIDQDNLLFSALFPCFLHEVGHYVAIIVCGGKVEEVQFTVVGGNMSLPIGLSYEKELFCALSGPMVNVILGTICTLLGIWEYFAGFNYVLACLNLLPVKKLDGGRGVQCLLSILLPVSYHPQKEVFLTILDQLCSLLVLAFGCYLLLEGGSITLFILGLWLVWA